MKREIVIGFFVGIIANAIGFALALLFLGNGEPIEKTFEQSLAAGVFGKLVTIGAILNLVAFFLFIKRKQDYRARGVILATVLVAISTFLVNIS